MGALEWPPISPVLSNLGFSLFGYVKNKIWDAPHPQRPVLIQQRSLTIVRECRSMSALLIQNAFDDMVKR